MDEGQRVPEDLAQQVPDPELVCRLAGLDLTRINEFHLVNVLVAWTRVAAFVQANMYEVMARLANVPTLGEYTADELRVALRWTKTYADGQLSTALRVVEDLPRVHEALKSGKIQPRIAEDISNGTMHLNPAEAVEVAETMLGDIDKAATDSDGFGGLTSGQVRERLRRRCAEVDPESAKRRYKQGVEERRFVAEQNPDGTAELAGSNLPTDRAACIKAEVQRAAQQVKCQGLAEGRTMDQIRADVYLDKLEGVDPLAGTRTPSRTNGAASGAVEVTIPFDTLIGQSDRPGDLAGWGPILADVARQVVERQRHGQWRFSITDPETGQLLDQVLTRRRPPEDMARFVRARDKTCRNPACRAPASRCDLDHTIARFDGGLTHEGNLGPECRHDHRVKHEAGWKLEQPTPGVFVWTTATGHRHTVRPPEY